MKFSELLWQDTEHIFEACWENPFVQGIGKGKLPKASLIHYVKQDFEYLNAMIKAKAIGVTKCTSREDMIMFKDTIDFVLNSETHPHHNLCEQAGVAYEELQGYALAPVSQHYVLHMLHHAEKGNLGDVIAVTLACPWVYLYVGERLMKEVEPDGHHPFNDWIRFYGDREEREMYKYIDRLDELAETATEEEKQRWRTLFMEGCQLEYMFFEDAYHAKDWPFARTLTDGEKA